MKMVAATEVSVKDSVEVDATPHDHVPTPVSDFALNTKPKESAMRPIILVELSIRCRRSKVAYNGRISLACSFLINAK